MIKLDSNIINVEKDFVINSILAVDSGRSIAINADKIADRLFQATIENDKLSVHRQLQSMYFQSSRLHSTQMRYKCD